MFGKLATYSIAYYLLNITGSACLIANTIYHHAIPSAVVNIVWIIFAGLALFKKKPANMAIGKQEKCHLLLLDWLEIQGRVQGAITNLIN